MIDLTQRCADLDIDQPTVEHLACVSHTAYRAWTRTQSVFDVLEWHAEDNDMKNLFRAGVLDVLGGNMPHLGAPQASRLTWGVVRALHPKRM